MKLFNKLATLAAFCAPLTFAPNAFGQDSSGNHLLSGSYRFRYVAPGLSLTQGVSGGYNSAGNVIEVVAANGVIIFNGTGTYTIAQGSTYIDNTQNSGKPQEFPTTAGGSYSLSASGIGYIESPLASLSSNYEVADLGTYSDGVFTGSATESASAIQGGLNDLFVVMLVGTPPTNATFTSPYWLGVLDYSAGGDTLAKNALMKISPNGNGGLGTLTMNGQTNNQPNDFLTQTVTGATYNFASDGGATLTLPLPSTQQVCPVTTTTCTASGVTTAQALFTGSRLMYVSSDGNFTLGWNVNGYDIIVGVRALTSAGTNSLFKGLYYLGNMSDVPQQCGAQSYWGSENADGNENEVIHQRFFSSYCTPTGSYGATGNATDFGTDALTAINSDGTAFDNIGNGYAFGDSGNAFVAVSNSAGLFSLTIGIHAPAFSGSGVFLNPIGVVNAANWDPITAGIAPGELFKLFGTDLYSQSAPYQIISGGSPAATSLGGVQVLVNGQPVPVFLVSPGEVDALMPYGVTCASSTTAASCYAEVQVNNGGLLSNQVPVFLTDANSGIFAQGEDGIGDAIALDTPTAGNPFYVTEAKPAQPGDYITLALTGMGTVTPTVADGAVGPSNPFSYADIYSNAGDMLVFFNDYNNSVTAAQATVSFGALYPGFAALYQMNVQIPTTVGPGPVYIEIVTDNADVEQVTVCVTSCSASAAASNLTGAASNLAKAEPRRTLVPLPPPLQLRKARPQAAGVRGSSQTNAPKIERPLRTFAPRPVLPSPAPPPQN